MTRVASDMVVTPLSSLGFRINMFVRQAGKLAIQPSGTGYITDEYASLDSCDDWPRSGIGCGYTDYIRRPTVDLSVL